MFIRSVLYDIMEEPEFVEMEDELFKLMSMYADKLSSYESWLKYRPEMEHWPEYKRKKIELHNLKCTADELIYCIRLYVTCKIDELRTDPDYYKMQDTSRI